MGISPLWMFPILLALVLLGIPVAFSLMGLALAFGYQVFGGAVVHQFIGRINSIATNFELACVPLFIFMGAMLERSGIAEKLFQAMHLWTRRLPGGLAIGTLVMCVIFAASSGVIGATETIVGLLAIPTMLRHNYSKPLISGVICAGGSLGTIIPPSIAVVILAPLANTSIGDLFAGILVPGLMLTFFYMLYVFAVATIRPETAPRLEEDFKPVAMREKFEITLKALVPPMVMILCVLGSLFAGLASPTEASALGALGGFVLSALYGRLTLAVLHQALLKTLKVTSMIMLLIVGGSMFTGVFVAGGGASIMEGVIQSLSFGSYGTLIFVLFLAFLGGFFLDWISILLIFIPVFIPLMAKQGFETNWLCVLFLLIVQTSYLTPPMAPAIFYFRGVAPPEIGVKDVLRGVVPFIFLQLLAIALVILFPALVNWWE
ncbi:MAG: C4-dicarboxylate ABC transporter permease [Proteobacteria bacterium]|nr:MAG: C4-dicarboxylate ABC transporter permease [Pseudomonadota bacterium]